MSECGDMLDEFQGKLELAEKKIERLEADLARAKREIDHGKPIVEGSHVYCAECAKAMTDERVEEIRRAHAAEEYYCGLIGTKYQDVIGHLLTALAQAERERDDAIHRRDVLIQDDEWIRQERDAARAEVERLKAHEGERCPQCHGHLGDRMAFHLQAEVEESERVKGLGSELSNEKWKVSELIHRNDVLHQEIDKAEAALARVRERDHISEEGTACANCHDPVHAVELPRLRAALKGILEIGKRDMSNPKYDGYFDEARAALEGQK